MANPLVKFFKENDIPDENMSAENGNLYKIRNDIINSIYLISSILGIFPVLSTLVNVVKFGWRPSFIFNFLLCAIIWGVFLFRNKISLTWKANIFFIAFFILATFINYSNGVISGAINFVLITTLVTLIFGWKAGVASIVLTFMVRTIIGVLFLSGAFHL